MLTGAWYMPASQRGNGGNTEILANVEITSERWVITPRGLLYAAGLRGSVRGAWPLDAAPRRTLDVHEVLRLDLTGH